jgi:hypothetical protein
MSSSNRKRRIFQSVAFSAALLFILYSGQSMADDTVTAPQKELCTAALQPADPSVEKWGIEVTSLRMSANNHMVDFRYRVRDAKKADTLFSKDAKPYLVHQETGKALAVPRTAKVGPLMSTYDHKEGRIYWMFFGNQTNLVKAGDKVSVVIGDFKAENLTVQ